MTVELVLFAALREAFGTERLAVELPEGATGRALKEALAARYPRWARLVESCRLAAGVEFIDERGPLPGGSPIALIPPVSGGAPLRSSALGPEAIDFAALEREAVRRECGALCVFLGTVRSPNEGREVLHIDYEAHEPMALAVLDRIIGETEAAWPGSVLLVRHRLGRLEPGEVSVAVVASAPHRAAAFEACRHAIERLKADAPIWKREVFAGESRWVNAPPPGAD